MRSKYVRTAWLIDDGIIVVGHVCKRIFYPRSLSCGFSSQKIRRKDIGRILFYNEKEAKDSVRNAFLRGTHTYCYR